jgi:hypothetical protein
MIAADVLTDVDPAIMLIQDKILAYSEKAESGTLIHNSVVITQGKNIKKAGDWLNSFYNEGHSAGITDKQFSDMFAIISTMAGTDVKKFADDLASYAAEPFLSFLKTIDLKKENLKSPSDLLYYVFYNKEKIPAENIFSSLAAMIVSNDISLDKIKSMEYEKERSLWYLWILIGAGIIFIILFYRRKQKKDKK